MCGLCLYQPAGATQCIILQVRDMHSRLQFRFSCCQSSCMWREYLTRVLLPLLLSSGDSQLVQLEAVQAQLMNSTGAVRMHTG